MRKHMTHFDDCGCLTATHQQELSAARGMIADLLETSKGLLSCYRDDLRADIAIFEGWRDAIAKASEFLKADVAGDRENQ